MAFLASGDVVLERSLVYTIDMIRVVFGLITDLNQEHILVSHLNCPTHVRRIKIKRYEILNCCSYKEFCHSLFTGEPSTSLSHEPYPCLEWSKNAISISVEQRRERFTRPRDRRRL